MRYRGMIIAKECDIYQVRWFQEDLKLWHTWSPWCKSVEEAKAVIDKLVNDAEGE